ncbi:Alpha-1,3-mannosyltransferase-like protein, partial [Cryomyces antarcticus]
GPTETVVDGKTGWLRDVSKTEEWTDVMRKVLFELRDEQVRRMDEEGKRRVRDEFSKRRMAQRLDWEFDALASVRRPPLLSWEVVLVVMLSLVVALGAVTLS